MRQKFSSIHSWKSNSRFPKPLSDWIGLIELSGTMHLWMRGGGGMYNNNNGDVNENGKKACMCITLFGTFLCCHCMSTM